MVVVEIRKKWNNLQIVYYFVSDLYHWVSTEPENGVARPVFRINILNWAKDQNNQGSSTDTN